MYLNLCDWTNPRNIDTKNPYLYFIRVITPYEEFRYVGKGSSISRMDAYKKNVEKVLTGRPKRPPIKRDGSPQREGNLRFRFVHLVLAVAVQENWKVEFYPLENSSKAKQAIRERELILDLNCNMNDKFSWPIEEFRSLASQLRNGSDFE